MYSYKTKGTCSRQINFDIVDGRVRNISFVGGCHGNTQGVAALAEGMEAKKVIELLKDIDCRGRGTSCPAQLARALSEAIQNAS
ncbi:MAG TPA: TIGR03905 family TSCPD domain-containing protein [Candidatus Monoglobus merdigallinarum]|uniref:ribonucleoside-diphosphate reductase n=1 Tax=Candidatus Monoglobus merdigallinarum TaxID=2838698 RepID=A0A9D1TME9_9FIRM|nr:TIGR03905 family TSCPD domain-containing protein [Candidatus Monoglobus merdigallinarum]